MVTEESWYIEKTKIHSCTRELSQGVVGSDPDELQKASKQALENEIIPLVVKKYYRLTLEERWETFGNDAQGSTQIWG